MPQSKIIIIGSDLQLAASIGGVVKSLGGLCVHVIGSIEEALLTTWVDAAAVVVHLVEDGQVTGAVTLLRTIMALGRPVPMILIAERPMSEKAYGLVRRGAVDALARPVDTGRLGYLIETLTLRLRAPLGIDAAHGGRPCPADENGSESWIKSPSPSPSQAAAPAEVRPAVPEDRGDFGFITRSADMDRMVEQVRRVAAQDATVLLGGETGTGKTRLARLVHDLSPRRSEPFLVVNCGALSSTLIETEIFGHVKGAFTGADRDRVGRFAEVGRGTLLLDEVDMLSPEIQAKLLRVVEERVFEQVGSNRPTVLRARLIAASNRPLVEEVAAGRFRSDLFFRLNVVGFELPPLRERILPIADRRAVRGRVLDAEWAAAAVDLGRGGAGVARLRVAGQHPRATQRDRAGRGALPWLRDHAMRPAGAVNSGPRLPDGGGASRVRSRAVGGGDAGSGQGRSRVRMHYRGAREARQQPPPGRLRTGHQPDDPVQEALQIWPDGVARRRPERPWSDGLAGPAW